MSIYNPVSSPSLRAIITAPQESEKMFTVVRHMSKMRSVTITKPIPSSGSPTVFRMIAIATSDAIGTPATPIEVSSAVNTITHCVKKLSSIP